MAPSYIIKSSLSSPDSHSAIPSCLPSAAFAQCPCPATCCPQLCTALCAPWVSSLHCSVSDIYCDRDTPGSVRFDLGANWRERTSLGNNVTPTSPDEVVMTIYVERGKVQDLRITVSFSRRCDCTAGVPVGVGVSTSFYSPATLAPLCSHSGFLLLYYRCIAVVSENPLLSAVREY